MSLYSQDTCAKNRSVFPLTSLSIGFWSSRKSRKVLLLSLPRASKFVLLSVEDSRYKALGRFDKALLQVNSIWDSRNPFNAVSPSNQSENRSNSVRWVVAFEVEWAHIVGLDYRFCLLQEGRLVLETSSVVKRVFKTIEDVHAFYEWAPPDAEQPSGQIKLDRDDFSRPNSRILSNDCEGGLLQPGSAGFSPRAPKFCYAQPSSDTWTEEANVVRPALSCGSPPLSVHCRHETWDGFGGQVTPRGYRYSMGNLPCTPPRVLQQVHSWPSSQLCEALHLMGASHKDSSMCYRTPSIPGPARFTLPSATYKSQTVILAFCDPHLLSHLASWVKADVARVKMYESGLPSWAVFLPSYGLWYRPWMRTIAWVLYMAISIFSMACGFYDLYKNVPYLKQVVSSIMGRLYLPRYALLEWLEQHAQIRLSILLTYLFSKSPLFASFLRLLSSFLAVVQDLSQPLLSPLTPFWNTGLDALRAFSSGCCTLALSTQELLVLLLGPPLRTLLTYFVSTFTTFSEIVTLLGGWMGSALLTPFQLLLLPLWGLLAMLSALWQGMVSSSESAVVAWRAFRATWGTVKAGGKVVKGGLAAAAPVAQSAPMLSLLQVPAEALDMLKMSFVKVFKALQAVIKFLISLVLKVLQHRVSLTLQAYRYWAIMQTRTITRLRSSPWLARFLPAPTEPQPSTLEPFEPHASSLLASADYLGLLRSSLSRSSSSSSMRDLGEEGQDDVACGTERANVVSHPLSVRSTGGTNTDCSQEAHMPLFNGKRSSWREIPEGARDRLSSGAAGRSHSSGQLGGWAGGISGSWSDSMQTLHAEFDRTEFERQNWERLTKTGLNFSGPIRLGHDMPADEGCHNISGQHGWHASIADSDGRRQAPLLHRELASRHALRLHSDPESMLATSAPANLTARQARVQEQEYPPGDMSGFGQAWGVRSLPWASYPSLHVRHASQGQQEYSPKRGKVRAVQTAPSLSLVSERTEVCQTDAGASEVTIHRQARTATSDSIESRQRHTAAKADGAEPSKMHTAAKIGGKNPYKLRFAHQSDNVSDAGVVHDNDIVVGERRKVCFSSQLAPEPTEASADHGSHGEQGFLFGANNPEPQPQQHIRRRKKKKDGRKK